MYSKYDAILTAIQAIQEERDATERGIIYEDASEKECKSLLAEFDRLLAMLEKRRAQYMKTGK